MNTMQIKLNDLDRRKRLSDDDRAAIRQLWARQQSLPKAKRLTAEAIGVMYNVSKTTILVIVNPEYAASRKKYNADNCSKYYGNRTAKQRAKIAKDSRAYKKQLRANGLIGQEENKS